MTKRVAAFNTMKYNEKDKIIMLMKLKDVKEKKTTIKENTKILSKYFVNANSEDLVENKDSNTPDEETTPTVSISRKVRTNLKQIEENEMNSSKELKDYKDLPIEPAFKQLLKKSTKEM